MKEFEFETNNGEFVLVDGIGENFAMDLTHMVISNEWFVNLKSITEEQASQIVDEYRRGYKNYTWRDPKLGGQQVAMVTRDYYNKAVDSLYSLFDSKGLYLYENPFPKPENYDLWAKYGDFTQYGKQLTSDCLRWKESEEKTFYNPFIFKL